MEPYFKEMQPVYSKGDQSWVFFGRSDAKAETPVLWPPHAKSWLIGKDSDAGKDWGQEEKGMTEDEMAGWHHWLDGLESDWTPGVGDGQGGLACCDSQGCKESDTTERLNWTELIIFFLCVCFPLNIMPSKFTHVVSEFHFFLRLNNIPLLVYTLCLSIYLSIVIWLVSTFWLLWITLLWMWVYKYLFESLLSILLGLYLQVKFLDHMVILCLSFWGTALLFSTVTAPFYIPTSNAPGLKFLKSSPT